MPKSAPVSCWIVVHRKTGQVSAHHDGRVRCFTLEREAEEARALMRLRRQHRVAAASLTVKD